MLENRELYEVVLLLGTNLGDRRGNLIKARGLLSGFYGDPLVVSNELENKAVGFVGNDFLNQAVLFYSYDSPFEILKKTQQIEKKMGRKSKTIKKQYENRIIDLDILFVNDWVIQSPTLSLPHPQVFNRPFVALLLKDLLPKFQNPYIVERVKNDNLDTY